MRRTVAVLTVLLVLNFGPPGALPAQETAPAARPKARGSANPESAIRGGTPVDELGRKDDANEASTESADRPDFQEGRPRQIDPDALLPRRRFAICIGIDGYTRESSYSPLSYSGADAISMAEIFLTKAKFDHVLLMTDAMIPPALESPEWEAKLRIVRDVTYDSIHRHLRSFPRQANRFDDVLVFFYAGHGDRGRRFSYLVPLDHTPDSPQPLYLNDVFLQLSADDVRARNKLFIIDACRSSPNDTEGNVMSPAFRDELIEPGARLAVITGCDSGESSYEDAELKHGRFTWALLDALSGNGFRPGEEYLYVSDLTHHVSKTFREKAWDRQQEPQPFLEGVAFAIAHRPAVKPPPLDEFEWEELRADHDKARAAYRSGQLERASSAYRYVLRVIESAPQSDNAIRQMHGQSLFERARVQYRLGQVEESLALREAGMKLRDKSPILTELEAYDLAAKGQEREAVQKLQQAIDAAGNREDVDAYLWSRKAALQESLSDFVAATHSYCQAALASSRAGNKQDAELFFEQARAIDFDKAWLLQAHLTGHPELGVEAVAATFAAARDLFGVDHWETKSRAVSLEAIQTQSKLPPAELRMIWETEVLYSRLSDLDLDVGAASVSMLLGQLEEGVHGPTHPWHANSLINTGRRMRDEAKYAESIPAFREALQIYEKHYGPASPSATECAGLLANSLRRCGQEAEADVVDAAWSGPRNTVIATLAASTSPINKSRAARMLYYDNRFEESIPLFEAAAKGYEQRNQRETVAWMQGWIADAYRELKQEPQAFAAFMSSLAAFRALEHDQGISYEASGAAKALYRMQRYEEAIPLFDEARRAYTASGQPGSAAWMRDWIGDALRKLKRSREALPLYEETLADFRRLERPRDVAEVLYEIGDTHYEMQQWEQAIPWFEAAVKSADEAQSHVRAAWSVSMHGLCRRKLGDDPGALALYQDSERRFRATKHSEDIAPLYLCIGQALSRLNRPGEAIPSFIEAANINQQRGQIAFAARVQIELGNCYGKVKQADQAMAAFREAERQISTLEKRDAFAEDVLALSLYNQLRYDEAHAQFATAAAAYDRQQQPLMAARMLEWQGDCLAELKRHDEAREVYAEALRRYAANEHKEDLTYLTQQHAKSLFRTGRYEEAIPGFEKVIKSYDGRQPKDAAWIYAWLGDCYVGLKRDDAAVSAYQETVRRFAAIEHDERIAHVHRDLAKALFRLKRFEEAGASFRDAAAAYEKQESPLDATWMYAWLGDCYASLQKVEPALTAFNEAISRFEKFKHEEGLAINRYHRARVLKFANRIEDAIADLEASVAGYDKLGNKLQAAWVRSWLGDCRRDLGQDEQAVAAWQASVATFKELKNPVGISDDASDLAYALRRLNLMDGAIEAAKLAIPAYETMQRPLEIAQMDTLLGLCYLDQKNWAESRNAFDRALSRFEDLKQPSSVAQVAELIAKSLEKAGRTDDACRYYERSEQAYLAIKDEAKAQEMRAAKEKLLPKQDDAGN